MILFIIYMVQHKPSDHSFTGNIQGSCERYHFMPRFVHRSTSKLFVRYFYRSVVSHGGVVARWFLPQTVNLNVGGFSGPSHQVVYLSRS